MEHFLHELTDGAGASSVVLQRSGRVGTLLGLIGVVEQLFCTADGAGRAAAGGSSASAASPESSASAPSTAARFLLFAAARAMNAPARPDAG